MGSKREWEGHKWRKQVLPRVAASLSLCLPQHPLLTSEFNPSALHRESSMWPSTVPGVLLSGGASTFPGLQQFTVQLKANHVTYFNHNVVCYKIELLTPPFHLFCKEQMSSKTNKKIVISVLLLLLLSILCLWIWVLLSEKIFGDSNESN
jgi:hypothetical protein